VEDALGTTYEGQHCMIDSVVFVVGMPKPMPYFVAAVAHSIGQIELGFCAT